MNLVNRDIGSLTSPRKPPYFIIWVLAALATMTTVTACLTVNVPSTFVLRGNTSDGLAVVSLSSEGLGVHDALIWKYRQLNGTDRGRLETKGFTGSLDWESPPGRLAYFALPPGQYEFYESTVSLYSPGGMTWTMGSGGIATNSNPWNAGFNQSSVSNTTVDPFSVKFTIRAGELTYIGNLHLYWRPHAKRAFVVVRDQSARDLSLLSQKYPGAVER